VSFIDDPRGVYGVEPIYAVVPIAPSTYHAEYEEAFYPRQEAPAELTALT
jgi:putative transposase